MKAQGALTKGEGNMFGLKRKARKAQAQVDAAQPKVVEVWYRSNPTHPWKFMNRFERMTDAQAAARHMTLAEVDIRPYY